MNKFLSLLLAGGFFVILLLLIAGVMWFTDAPVSQTLNKSNSSSQSPYDSLSHEVPPTPPQFSFPGDDELSYSILCQINDPAGMPLHGVTVLLESIDSEPYQHSSKTDKTGLCNLMVLQTGVYKISAASPGFSAAEDIVTIDAASPRQQSRLFQLSGSQEEEDFR